MQNNKSKKILIELGVYTLLFGLSFLLPVSISYEDYSMQAIPRYLPDYPLIYLSVILFAVVILAIISKRKVIIHISNAFAILLTLVLYLLICLGQNWSGRQFHPDFGYGYSLSQLMISVLIIRSYTLLCSIGEYHFNQRLSRIAGIVAITIPSVLFCLFLYTLIVYP